MRHTLSFLFLSSFLLSVGTVHAYEDCTPYLTDAQGYSSCLARVSAQLQSASQIFNVGYLAYDAGRYTDAIFAYQQYLQINTDPNDTNHKSAENNLKVSYEALGTAYFARQDWSDAIGAFRSAVAIDPTDYGALTSLAAASYNAGNYTDAVTYYQQAHDHAATQTEADTAIRMLSYAQAQAGVADAKKNAPTNDPLSYLQYALPMLHIPEAWAKVTGSREVIVAVIDDGVNINHPDLAANIWTDPNAPYGSSKIKNFTGDNLPDNLPTGSHGTMVAGIIGAITNNNLGIAGIAKNVKIMPLRVFGKEEESTAQSIIDAIDYAIDHGANIINISIGSSQFEYVPDFDAVLQRAYVHGVVVVVAGGNGDMLAQSNSGVDTTNNPLSPVCNNHTNKKSIIGVGALDQSGQKASWSDYGDCIGFFAPGVDIVSTSVPAYDTGTVVSPGYSQASGTSFSAPIVAGIVALGYNQYGPVAPGIVYDTLASSVSPDGSGSTILDASLYIDTLGRMIHEQTLRTKVDVWFSRAKLKLRTMPSAARLGVLSDMRTQLLSMRGHYVGDKKYILGYLLTLVNAELTRR